MPEQLLTIEEARARVLAAIVPLPTETIEVVEAAGRVLAEDVLASGDTPPFASSAMDGYAIEPGPADRTLALIGESRAGAPSPLRLAPGAAIRISTGAAIPDGAGAVIRQEDVVQRDGQIVTTTVTEPGENVRHAGEDMAAGTVVLTRGLRLGPAELGAAVAAGAARLEVAVRPRLRVLCTGDELREPGAPLGPGEIHNSNGPMLVALARRAGAAAPESLRLRDDLTATTAALDEALAGADVVVVSGGVSVGPHDHVKPALRELGVEERFWRVALQPGKPTWFGTRGAKLVFGLPGNPVSAHVTFTLFVAPALAALQGASASQGLGQASLAEPVRRNPQREQAIRVRLEPREAGLVAVPNGPQGSHIITSLVGADALALIPPGQGELPAGATVVLLALGG